jgi:Kef-type K+ transport system membrane component KefB
VGQRIHVPRVTLLLLLGVAAGPVGLDLLPAGTEKSFSLVTNLALAMVGFLLGERMALRELRRDHRLVLGVSLGVVLATAALVFVGVWWLSGNLVAALILAGVAPATAPAATVDIIHEAGAKGPLTRIVSRVVAIDDVWCVMLFSVLLVIAEGLNGGGLPWYSSLGQGLWELAGAAALGLALGFPMAWLTGRVRKGEPQLLEAVGFVLVCAGLAQMLHLSYLLACMVMGTVVANRAHHHLRPFRSIQGVADPFLAVFFFLAGYELDVPALLGLGWAGLAYLVLRVLGRVAGGYLGATWAGASQTTARRIGWCLLPQAGVALGLALLATERLPETTELVLPLAIGSTVFFELIGPVFTLRNLRRAGETH